MSLSLGVSVSALGPSCVTVVSGQGGVEPYVYSVDSGVGVIDEDTGFYQAPSQAPLDPKNAVVTLKVVDAALSEATAQFLVLHPILLFCEVLQRELNLAPGRVWIWDQKKSIPLDGGLYIVVSMLTCEPFANTFKAASNGAGLDAQQSVNMKATLSVAVMSNDNSALFMNTRVLMALQSAYSQSQQEINSFYIAKLPPGSRFVNLSHVEGNRIPYRFDIAINIQYFDRLVKSIEFFSGFETPEVETEP